MRTVSIQAFQITNKNLHILSAAFVILIFILYTTGKIGLNCEKNYSTLEFDYFDNENKIQIWQNTPSVTLMCRLYAGSASEYYNIFNVGYMMFWPIKSWKNSDVVIIFDDEQEADHRMGI